MASSSAVTGQRTALLAGTDDGMDRHRPDNSCVRDDIGTRGTAEHLAVVAVAPAIMQKHECVSRRKLKGMSNN